MDLTGGSIDLRTLVPRAELEVETAVEANGCAARFARKCVSAASRR